jgi:hypothetical protein
MMLLIIWELTGTNYCENYKKTIHSGFLAEAGV